MTTHNRPSGDKSNDVSTAGATPTGGSADARNPDWDSYVTHGHGRTDEQVRADVQQLIIAESERLGDNSSALAISIQDGIVTLEGEVLSEALQQHLIESIRAVPSVREARKPTRARKRS